MATVLLERVAGTFGFAAKDEKGHLLNTDGSPENGGADFGFRPMQLLLAALGSCSAIDIIAILNKQKQDIKNFKIEVEGQREKQGVPALWKTITVIFHLSGNISIEKAERAVALSMEKYCSVAETLRRGGTTIFWQTNVNSTNEKHRIER